MDTIKDIKVDIIEDSRKVPTLSVTVVTDNGFSGNCMVPSGASTGEYEAYEMRDDGNSHGGVTKAKEKIISFILPNLVGKNVEDQKLIDSLMIALDGTPNKQNLGGNSILGVSVAVAKAAAASRGQNFYEYLRTLDEVTSTKAVPYLYFNLINGGKHAATKLAFQEYHVVPMVNDINESLAIAQTVQNKLGEIVAEKYGEVTRGDEGGYAIPEEDVRIPLTLLSEAVSACGFKDKVLFALDVASTSFYNKEKKVYEIAGRDYTKEEMRDMYISLTKEFPFISIEDPFFEEDFDSFAELQALIPNVVLVGDDLTVTNVKRVKQAVENKSIKGLIVKPNQIGSVTETVETITYAQKQGVNCIVSHRSGETMDDMIADIAFAFHAFGMKSGARGPKEREVKYSRLANITSQK